jgi:F0F1-type ATP synthase assembly protein I
LATASAASKESVKMRDEKPQKREESPWVMAARYSEIGFLIPAAVFVGYLLGLGADRFLHTHWIYLFGIIFGAVAGFVSMIRRALQASAEEDKKEKDSSNEGH